MGRYRVTGRPYQPTGTFHATGGRTRSLVDCPYCLTLNTLHHRTVGQTGTTCRGCSAMFGSDGICYPLDD